MFNTKPDTEHTESNTPRAVAQVELIPLSVLKLDLDPGEEWATFLGRRAIAIVPDALGRDAIGVDAARRLLDERRGDQLRQRKRAAVQQEMEEEADRLRRALIWKGVSATALPAGVGAGDAMLQAARDSRPRRTTPLEEALSNEGTVFHAFDTSDEE